ncbi:MAG: DUF4369 domain-containing protein, partial [Maribacter sp.]
MKNSLLLIGIAILMFSCNQEPDGFTINGTMRGEFDEGTSVFLKKISDENQPIEVDTAVLKEGTFQFKGIANAPELHYIFVDKIPGYTAVILENGKIDFSAQKDSLGYAEVNGTPQNEVFGDYLEKSRELSNRRLA